MLRRSLLLAAAVAAIAGAAAPAAHAAPFQLDIHFSKTPAKLSNQATPTFSLYRNVHFGVKAQTCRVDAGAWKACSSPWKPGRLRDGRHTAQAKLVMTNGHVAGSSFTWTIDTVAPVAPSPQQNLHVWTDQIAIPLSAGTDAGTGVASQQWRSSDGHVWSAWFDRSAHPSATAPADGRWNFQYRVTDRAGNQTTVLFAQGQDSTPPPMPYIYRGSQLETVTAPTTLGVGQCCDDPESGISGRHQYEISTDGGDTWSDPAEYTGEFTPTDPGSYTMRARTENNAGLWSDWTTPDADATEIYQPVPPAIPVMTGGHGSVPNPGEMTSFEWQPVVDPVDNNFAVNYEVQLRVNGSDWMEGPNGTYTSFGLQGCGFYEVRVRAQGSTGLWSDWSAITDDSTELLTCTDIG